jgi:hypothetical protein
MAAQRLSFARHRGRRQTRADRQHSGVKQEIVMAEPIRAYTPQRNVREELRAKVEDAPIHHAQAVLAAYELLQVAQDHGVLDTLRGAIGADDAIIGMVTEYANSPEDIRAMRNFLALSRVFANLDPAKVDAVAKALTGDQGQKGIKDSKPPSVWQTFQRMTGHNSRRTLATIAAVTDAFGREQEVPEVGLGSGPHLLPPGTVFPLVAMALVAVAGFWIGRRT